MYNELFVAFPTCPTGLGNTGDKILLVKVTYCRSKGSFLQVNSIHINAYTWNRGSQGKRYPIITAIECLEAWITSDDFWRQKKSRSTNEIWGERWWGVHIGKTFLFDFNGHENPQAQCGHTSCKQIHLQSGTDVNNKGSNQI